MLLAPANGPLNLEELDQLDRFLSVAWLGPLALPLTEVHGLMTALASAPHFLLAQAWQIDLLKKTVFNSLAEARTIMEQLLRLQQAICLALRKRKGFKPLLWDEGRMVSLKEASPTVLAAWCKGYLTGVEMDPSWYEDDQLIEQLLPFFLLETQDVAADFSNSKGPLSPELALEWKKAAREQLPDVIHYFYDYWEENRQSGPPWYEEDEETEALETLEALKALEALEKSGEREGKSNAKVKQESAFDEEGPVQHEKGTALWVLNHNGSHHHLKDYLANFTPSKKVLH